MTYPNMNPSQNTNPYLMVFFVLLLRMINLVITLILMSQLDITTVLTVEIITLMMVTIIMRSQIRITTKTKDIIIKDIIIKDIIIKDIIIIMAKEEITKIIDSLGKTRIASKDVV